MSWTGTIFFFSAVCANLLIVFPQSSHAQQTPIQRQCSKQADALGLHGEARKAFRSQCKGQTSQGNSGVSIGMTAEQVRRSSWGKPKSINETITAGGKHEQWIYGGGYLYLENGVLTSIQTHR
jgi:hypothetical protein